LKRLKKSKLNPDPHSPVRICPHCFQRPINKKSSEVQKIGKNYLFHGKLQLNQCLGLCTPQKTKFFACFCLFYASEQVNA
jgi:hypothetical protein